LTGIIKKKSPKAVLGRHVWQARYFVLTSSELVYYKNMKDYQAKKPATGSISLQAITKIRVLRTKSAGRFDLLTNQSNRIWAFKADQSGTWVKKIQQTCEALGQADVGVVTAKKPAAETKDNHKRRAGITSAGAAGDEDISAEDQKKGPEDVTFIKNAVKNLKTFKNTSAEELDAIVSAMYKVSIKTGGVVQKEGENADKLYVVAKGGFNLIQADLDTDEPVVISELKQGGIVTEYALLYEQESDYTFEASRATTLWAITRHQYRDIIKTARQAGFAARVKFIKQTVLLGKFAKQDLNKIAEALEVASYKKGTNIVTQGEVGDAFYLLVKGTAVAKIDGNDVKEYNDAGDFFGERSLIRDETRAATVTATSNCEVLALKKKDFTALMGDVSGLLSKLEEE
jgi:CRP-like cAMP-binding protein